MFVLVARRLNAPQRAKSLSRQARGGRVKMLRLGISLAAAAPGKARRGVPGLGG